MEKVSDEQYRAGIGEPEVIEPVIKRRPPDGDEMRAADVQVEPIVVEAHPQPVADYVADLARSFP